jgi:4-hydroxy-tetrahydrodipicolinate reductase
MGRTVCEAVGGDPELMLAAGVDPFHDGLDIEGVSVVGGPTGLKDDAVEVMVDFTEAEAARENMRWCAEHGVHAVVGTSGLGEADVKWAQGAFTSSNCVVVPNFAIGAVLLVRLAEIAAPYFESVEVIELHHDQKIDAPSGTAMHTLERLAAAKSTWTDDPTTRETIAGARGAKGPAGIPVHAVRLRGLFAHEEVLFGTTGQMLTIRHDAFDRSSMMPGVLMAVKQVGSRPGVTVGLDALLGF